jgi:hypothetical protein
MIDEVTIVNEILDSMSEEELERVGIRFRPGDKRIRELLETLSPSQIEFVRNRLLTKTDTAAAADTGLTKNTVARWEELPAIREVIDLANRSATDRALAVFENNIVTAANEIVDQLHHKSAWVRMQAAKETLDRFVGKSVQRNENTNNGELKVRYVDDWRNLPTQATLGPASSADPEEEI